MRALQKQTIADRLEIIIMDNHSEDDSIGILRNTFEERNQKPKTPSDRALVRAGKNQSTSQNTHSTHNIKIIETSSNFGYSKGNNAAGHYATGQYLLIINPDNLLEPDGLEKLIATVEADPTIGIIAPKLIHEDGTVRDSARAFPSVWDVLMKRTFLRHLFPGRLGKYLQRDSDRNTMRDVDWVVGACLLIRRDLFAELGGFDERFFLFFEDIDLCRRTKALGKRVVYDPRVQATDRKSRLSEGGPLTLFTKKTVRIHLHSAIQYFWKWRTYGSR